MKPVYLDHAATTPIDPEVRAALAPYLAEAFGNPSSRYPLGVRAKEAVDRARGQVARAVGARARDVTFTSGGTESNNLAVLGLARARGLVGARGLVIGPTEHPSVREAALALASEGFEVKTARLREDGALDLEHYETLLDEDTILVAQMLVSNELGTVYPVRELARLVRRRAPNAVLHVDAVQALGKLELSPAELGADTLAFSAHKLHAPKGAGALVRCSDAPLRPILYGGGQESGLRSGTENVAGIVAFGEAARLADERRAETVRTTTTAREAFARGLAGINAARLVEPGAASGDVSPAICVVFLSGAPAEVWLHHLEAKGVFASAGSACQAGKSATNPTYTALGLSAEEAKRVMRFSFARETTLAEVERALDVLAEIATGLEAVRS